MIRMHFKLRLFNLCLYLLGFTHKINILIIYLILIIILKRKTIIIFSDFISKISYEISLFSDVTSKCTPTIYILPTDLNNPYFLSTLCVEKKVELRVSK